MVDYKVHKLFPVPLFQFKVANHKELNKDLFNASLELLSGKKLQLIKSWEKYD